MKASQVAFITITATAIAAIGLTVGAAVVASPITMIALAALAGVAAAFNISSITAWVHSEPNETGRQYLERTCNHLAKAIPALCSFVGQVFFQTLIIVGVERLIGGRCRGCRSW